MLGGKIVKNVQIDPQTIEYNHSPKTRECAMKLSEMATLSNSSGKTVKIDPQKREIWPIKPNVP